MLCLVVKYAIPLLCMNFSVIVWCILKVYIFRVQVMVVRYHCGGWPEEVNTCFLNSYMVYL
jgi:hypothetical protein